MIGILAASVAVQSAAVAQIAGGYGGLPIRELSSTPCNRIRLRTEAVRKERRKYEPVFNAEYRYKNAKEFMFYPSILLTCVFSALAFIVNGSLSFEFQLFSGFALVFLTTSIIFFVAMRNRKAAYLKKHAEWRASQGFRAFKEVAEVHNIKE